MSDVNIRSQIHQIVSSMSPLDELEQDHIRFVLDWIDSGREIFRIEKPATPETGFTKKYSSTVAIAAFNLISNLLT